MNAKVPNEVTINGHVLPPYHVQVVKDALDELHARLSAYQNRALLESVGMTPEADAERKKRLTALKQIHTLFQ